MEIDLHLVIYSLVAILGHLPAAQEVNVPHGLRYGRVSCRNLVKEYQERTKTSTTEHQQQ